jgi:hypothetical protein
VDCAPSRYHHIHPSAMNHYQVLRRTSRMTPIKDKRIYDSSQAAARYESCLQPLGHDVRSENHHTDNEPCAYLNRLNDPPSSRSSPVPRVHSRSTSRRMATAKLHVVRHSPALQAPPPHESNRPWTPMRMEPYIRTNHSRRQTTRTCSCLTILYVLLCT